MANIEINYLSSDNIYIKLYPLTTSSNVTDLDDYVNNLITEKENGKANFQIQRGTIIPTENFSSVTFNFQFSPDILISTIFKDYSNNTWFFYFNETTKRIGKIYYHNSCCTFETGSSFQYELNIFDIGFVSATEIKVTLARKLSCNTNISSYPWSVSTSPVISAANKVINFIGLKIN